MEKGKKYVCKPMTMDCISCKHSTDKETKEKTFCFCDKKCSVPLAIVKDEQIVCWLPVVEDKQYIIGIDLGSEEGDKSSQNIIDMQKTEISDLKKKIESTKKDLKKMENQLYDMENKHLFDRMEEHIGKCYASKNTSTDCEHLIRVEGIDKENQIYKVTSIDYESTLIGWYNISVSYNEMFYPKLNDYDWEEISEAQFVARVKMNLAFAEKEITKNQEK